MWLQVPFWGFAEIFYPLNLVFIEKYGVVVCLLAIPAVAALIWLQPYRIQKIATAIFSAAILYSGMLKFRADLTTMLISNYRYVFAGSFFFVWMLACFASSQPRWRLLTLFSISLALTSSVYFNFSVERVSVPERWADYADAIGRRSITIPFAPRMVRKNSFCRAIEIV